MWGSSLKTEFVAWGQWSGLWLILVYGVVGNEPNRASEKKSGPQGLHRRVYWQQRKVTEGIAIITAVVGSRQQQP